MPGFSLQRTERPDGRPEGIWTPYGPELTEAEEQAGQVREAYKIRPLHPSDMDHFREVAIPPNKWRQNQKVTEPDPKRYNELLYDFLIEDWQGLYQDDAHTIPAECSLENKLMLAGKSLERANFIVLQGSLYANDDDARQEAQRQSFRRTGQVSARLSGADV
jgi:hypothetical protein